jgi:hypothetical protein
VPPFGEIRTLSQLPGDLIIPPTFELDEETGVTWIGKLSGFRTGEIFLRGRHPVLDVASYFHIHMQIARWKPGDEPVLSRDEGTLVFHKGLDRCRIVLRQKGETVRVRMAVNPASETGDGSAGGSGGALSKDVPKKSARE